MYTQGNGWQQSPGWNGHQHQQQHPPVHYQQYPYQQPHLQWPNVPSPYGNNQPKPYAQQYHHQQGSFPTTGSHAQTMPHYIPPYASPPPPNSTAYPPSQMTHQPSHPQYASQALPTSPHISPQPPSQHVDIGKIKQDAPIEVYESGRWQEAVVRKKRHDGT
jgi:hypothetical protein